MQKRQHKEKEVVKRRSGDAFYGPFARMVRGCARLFSRKYEYGADTAGDGPAVYVCRHLNMHGPYCTLKWLPFCVHSMVLSVFFERDSCYRQYTDYTYSARQGKRAGFFVRLSARLSAAAVPALLRSFQAFPACRDMKQAFKSLREGNKYLLRGESLIVYPDIAYTQGYDEVSAIYQGFLYFGEMYYKKTGRELRFIPLLIDDGRRCIEAGGAVTVNDYRREGDRAAQLLLKAINKPAAKETKGR